MNPAWIAGLCLAGLIFIVSCVLAALTPDKEFRHKLGAMAFTGEMTFLLVALLMACCNG